MFNSITQFLVKSSILENTYRKDLKFSGESEDGKFFNKNKFSREFRAGMTREHEDLTCSKVFGRVL
jgi:hypothetical protein